MFTRSRKIQISGCLFPSFALSHFLFLITRNFEWHPSNLLPSGLCYPGAGAQKAIMKTKKQLDEDAQEESAK